jgi:hypothetical protein
MSEVIDVSFGCGSYAGFLAGAGVRTVIRYYSRDSGHPEKRLTRPEASALAAAGLRLAVVHEAKFRSIGSFDQDLGELDAKYAHDYAASVISQPPNSAIYFGVDVDASTTQIRDRIVPYFQGVASAFNAAAAPSYQVGAYGSGATCDAVCRQDWRVMLGSRNPQAGRVTGSSSNQDDGLSPKRCRRRSVNSVAIRIRRTALSAISFQRVRPTRTPQTLK